MRRAWPWLLTLSLAINVCCAVGLVLLWSQAREGERQLEILRHGFRGHGETFDRADTLFRHLNDQVEACASRQRSTAADVDGARTRLRDLEERVDAIEVHRLIKGSR